MKIVEARTTIVGAPWRELTFLELSTDEGLTGLGEVLIRRGQLEEAVAQFEKAVTLKPELPDAHVALARALATQGKKNEAEKHYQEALRLLKLQAKVPQSRY